MELTFRKGNMKSEQIKPKEPFDAEKEKIEYEQYKKEQEESKYKIKKEELSVDINIKPKDFI